MKNTVIKSILALVMVFLALPMMGQDYMIIHFKNGNFRKFYMKNVTEIAPSKTDAGGIQHGEYNYQHIKTIYDNYTYNLEDVESITFTKVDEKLAKENFVSAMSTIFPIIDDCENIFDVEDKIDLIKNAKGVEEAWSDEHRLYVMIAEGETYSFNFKHDKDDENNSYEETIAQIHAMIPAMKKAAEESGKKLSAVVANQQDKDKGRSDKTKLYKDLVEKFKACNIDAKYEDNLSVDFFNHNSNDPEKRNIYDYNYIFLITHGGYGTYLYKVNDKIFESKSKVHDILLSEDIGLFNDVFWDTHYDKFKEWREKTIYKDVTDHNVNYSFCKETREDDNGKDVDFWVAHPSLTEKFFEDVAYGKFKDNSILFNTSCQSLKGDSKEEPSFSFAEILKQKNLGAYIGYDEIDQEGPDAGYDLYYYMLTGMSLKEAFNHLTDEERHDGVLEFEGWKPHYWVANLLIYPQNNPVVEKMFLKSTYTEPIEQETVMANFYDKHEVEVFGYGTALNFRNIPFGFEYDTNDSFSTCKEASNVLGRAIEPSENILEGNFLFKGQLTDLEYGKTYYYRAYTKDGEFYNYGEPESFTIYEKLNFSENPINLSINTKGTVQITSGSGSYSIESIVPQDLVTAEINGRTIDIIALKAGYGYILVKDVKSGQEATVEVTVYPDLSIAIIGNIDLDIDVEAKVRINSGSGEYTLDSSNPEVATASVIGEFIVVKTYAEGTATITVKDDKTGQKASFTVTVTAPVSYPSCPDDHHPHLIDLGLPSGTKWACCNVGATTPDGYGGYYAWGETEEKSTYNWSNYIHCDGSEKTCHDLGSDIACTQYDVAHVKWGDTWCMPSEAQQKELRENCSSEWTTVNGVKGKIFTGSNGGSIFLPASGYRNNGGCYYRGSRGYYLSSTQYPSDLFYAYNLGFESGRYWYHDGRHLGQNVRPVVATNNFTPLQLSTTSLSLTVGDQRNVGITSGSGSYSIEKINPEGVVIASIVENNSVAIEAHTVGTAVVTIKDNKSGQTAAIEVTVTGSSLSLCPDNHHPHMIDLGLPSGTKWACCNVDTDHPEKQSPTNYGGYYAWGETETKSIYGWSTYTHCDGSASSCHDLGTDIACTQYDVAHVKWGSNWAMPSYDQQTELRENCSSEWTTLNGIKGRIFTGSNGNRVFLPAAGYHWNDEHCEGGTIGNYWSSALYSSNSGRANALSFDSNRVYWYNDYCNGGRSVRPVVATNSFTPLQLSTTSLSLTVGDQGNVEITSGSGSYSIEKIEPEGVVSASINGNIVAIEAKTAGTAVITIKDSKSGKMVSIEVAVSGGSAPTYYLSCPDDHHPHMIDLGLPSGTIWACCNVGATKPEDYGGYYAWGETEEKDYYDWSTYIHCDGSKETCHDLSKVVGTEYDVAHVKWGGNWVMPSYNRICELYEDCNYKWTNINGVNGVKFTGASGGSIFLPAAGGRSQDKLSSAGDVGLYWSTLDEKKYKACLLYFNSDDVLDATSTRNLGLSVRPVTSKK